MNKQVKIHCMKKRKTGRQRQKCRLQQSQSKPQVNCHQMSVNSKLISHVLVHFHKCSVVSQHVQSLYCDSNLHLAIYKWVLASTILPSIHLCKVLTLFTEWLSWSLAFITLATGNFDCWIYQLATIGSKIPEKVCQAVMSYSTHQEVFPDSELSTTD